MSKASHWAHVNQALAQLRGLGADADRLDGAASARLGLNRTDMRVMEMLDRAGPMTAGELAAATRLSNAAVTTVIDRMAGRGFAVRRYDPGDRRRVVVELTELAQKQSELTFGGLVAALTEMLESYPDEKLAAAADIVARARQALSSHIAELERMTAAAEPDDRGRPRPPRPTA